MNKYMQWLGLLVEAALLGLAIYLYLFAIGAVKIKQAGRAEKAEKFRQENRSWLRILALALMAIMFFNVALSLSALF